MKILFHYLKPHKWLVTLVLILAAINIGFSLFDPIILGKLINLATYHTDPHFSHWHDFLFAKATITEKIPKINKNGVAEITLKTKFLYGMVWLLLASITVAMISRIAKNFQDYFLNVGWQNPKHILKFQQYDRHDLHFSASALMFAGYVLYYEVLLQGSLHHEWYIQFLFSG